MALSSKLFCAIFAVSTFAVFGISELDDSTGFFQRRQLEYVTADAVEPATDVPVGEAHPQKAGADFFKNVVSRINVAIDKVRNDLETKARTVIIRAKEEMKTAGEQMNDELKETVRAAVKTELEEHAAKQSLLEMNSEEMEEAPEPSGEQGKKKAKFDPFHIDFTKIVPAINQAIDPVKESVEKSTRVLIHDATDQLTRIGEKITQSMKDTIHATVAETLRAQVSSAEQPTK